MQLLDLFFRDFLDATSSYFSDTSRINYPVDIYKTDKGISIDIAMVGANKDGLSISVEDGDVLKIKYGKDGGCCDCEKDDGCCDSKYICHNIARRNFSYGWKFSNKYDLDNIDAELKDGLLEVAIPLKAEMKPKKVKVR
ncbi:MAG: Hsp20/alpha crystallin family protein [Actinobacteria bacterium]|nr:Hsp20/alpha crystallin family protein [Actinomycetota bacterium]